ncbi:MAG TPA: restriction endonuclease subunit S [Acidobacteriota bacterium]|jgi:type I restriction enzyme S subunit
MSTEARQVKEPSASNLAQADVADVPPGYKRTEAGVIPQDWNAEPLLTVLRLPTGQVDPRREPYRSMVLVAPDHVEVATGRLLTRETSAEQQAISGKYPFRSGDIVYSKIRPYLRKAILADFDGLCSADMYPLSPTPDVSPGFMLAVLLGHDFSTFAEGVSARSGIPKINRDELAEYRVALPSHPEQRAIAEVLSDVAGLLGALETLIAKKRAIKQGAMQQLLTGKTRLPGFSGEWDAKRLGDFASIRNQKLLPANLAPETPCVELEHIGQNDGRLLACSAAKNSTSIKYKFLTGDVLFGRLRSYLRKFWLADRDGICTTEIWPLVVDPQQAVGGFLHAVVQTDRFIEASSISYGTHMPRADWGVMRNFEIYLPQLDEQTAIATVLSDMYAEIVALEHRRDKTRAIKQGMMQQLLTGRLRLVKPASQPEAAC